MRGKNFPIDDASIVHKGTRGSFTSLCIYLLLLGIAYVASCGAILFFDGARAGALGQIRYSRAEMTAVLSLHRYADSGAESDYRDFLAAIAVPRADHIARLALERSPPDLARLRNKILSGENYDGDISTLIAIYRELSSKRSFGAAVDAWHEYDRLDSQLIATAKELHDAVVSGRSTEEKRRQLLDRIDRTNSQFSLLQNRSSARLGEASGSAAQFVIVALGISTIVLCALGMIYAFAQMRRQIALYRQLAASERRFRDFAELASDGYWETDTEGRTVYISERLSAMLGGRQVAVRPAQDYVRDNALTPEQRDAFVAARADRQPFRGLQVQLEGPNGDPRYWSLAGKPRFGADGTFLGYRGISNDITTAVLDAQTLQDARERAEAANRAKSAFLANMSHELRTPLNAILGFADMISQQILGKNAMEKYCAYASHIHDAGEHLLEIINDILDLSRIEAGYSELSESEIELYALAQSMRTLLGHRFKDNGTEFEIALPEPSPVIIVDERKFSQILINLLSNALKFTPPGGRVTFSAALRSDGGLLIRVSDTGVGIADEDIPVVLSPFGQVESAQSRKHHGTGLGLPLAKSFAELHGGSLSIQSKLDVGTTVTVCLPPSRVKHQEAPPACGPKPAASAA